MYMSEKIIESIKSLKTEENKRNFSQTFDLIVTLKELDVKKPENKFDTSFSLPKGRGKDASVILFTDSVKSAEGAIVLNSTEIAALAKNKREAKKLANSADFLFGEPKLMPTVAKALGTMLGPRGKIPKVLAGNVETLVHDAKHSTRVRVKGSPMIQTTVGTDKMSDEDVAANIQAVVKFIEGKLPGGKSNINKVMLKMTMTKPVKLEGV